ncbi:MAG: CPBP family intramembrane metalloprotease [Chthoniobacterales bacterium]|nr:CPBP family intramembrane metalloprotease [Chthoniobacterales bacterium]
MMLLTYSLYIALLISIITLWLPGKKTGYWKFFLLLALLLSFFSGAAHLIGIIAIVLFYDFLQQYHSSLRRKYFYWGAIFVLGFAFEIDKVPGFQPLWVINQIQFTSDAIPFSLGFNLGKISAGLILLGTLLPLASNGSDWKQLLQQTFSRLPLTLVSLTLLSMALGYIRWEPKLPPHLPLWMMSNLFFTCVAEEGFFRGFLQQSLSKYNHRSAPLIAILASAFFFGLAHYQGGIYYILLAAIAGIFYGWIYHVTKRIEASMITHFLLNFTQLLLFTYPALNR